MKKQNILEFIFTLITLFFLATLTLGVLIGITLAQEMAVYDVGFKARVFFIAGCFTLFLYITNLIVNRINTFFKLR